MHKNEKALLERCIKMDKGAWDLFVDRYSRLVSHAIVKTLEQYGRQPDARLVEDLFQSLFLSLLENNKKKLRQFRGESALSTWLHIIAVRMTIDYLRKQSRRPIPNDCGPDDTRIEFPSFIDAEALPSEAMIESEEKELFERARERLTPRERLFFDLYYRLELTYPEIANIFNTTNNSLYVLNSRIKEKMKRITMNFP